MPTFRSGTVTAILSDRAGLQRVDVDGAKAYVLTDLIGPVAVGDRVVMNTTAVELGLGTGGWHVVHWNLSRDEWTPPLTGREMKLRYTSLQTELPVDTAEGVPPPVVACLLHSQIAAVALAYKAVRPSGRLIYVMTDGGALPLAFSDLIAELQTRGVIEATVTAGNAFGGDAEATTIAHALRVAGGRQADLVVAGMGPGSLGIGDEVAFTGRDAVYVLEEATTRCLAVRYSDADARERHQGMSHHTRAVLDRASPPVYVPVPAGEPKPEVGEHVAVDVEVPDIIPALEELGATSMGRTPTEDPKFWLYAGAAGAFAAGLSQ